MLRFSVGVTRIDKNRNECNRGTTQATQKGREAKPRWCGYVQKRRSGYTGQRRDGASRQEGKTTKQVHGCSDGHGVTEEDDRNTYRQIICFSDLCRSGHSIKNGKLEWNTFLLNVFKKKKKRWNHIVFTLSWFICNFIVIGFKPSLFIRPFKRQPSLNKVM